MNTGVLMRMKNVRFYMWLILMVIKEIVAIWHIRCLLLSGM